MLDVDKHQINRTIKSVTCCPLRLWKVYVGVSEAQSCSGINLSLASGLEWRAKQHAQSEIL